MYLLLCVHHVIQIDDGVKETMTELPFASLCGFIFTVDPSLNWLLRIVFSGIPTVLSLSSSRSVHNVMVVLDGSI